MIWIIGMHEMIHRLSKEHIHHEIDLVQWPQCLRVSTNLLDATLLLARGLKVVG